MPSHDILSADYYTTLEVAKMLGMAVRSVQLMVDRGDLQAWKTPGGHRRITRESLERWVQSQGGGRGGLPVMSSTLSSATDDARVNKRRRGGLLPVPRVLLIEDSAHFQNLVTMLVKQKFPSVDLHVAGDGIAGLVAFGQLQPHLIIVDILLPGIDGVTMIMGLRRHALFGGCKLVVMTSLDEDQRAPYALVLQGMDVVHKSKVVAELPALIHRCLFDNSAPSAPTQASHTPINDSPQELKASALQ